MTHNTHNRLPDWRARLAVLVAQALATPFAWGQRDCCLWAADAVLATTGHDPAADLRGSYCTHAGAQRVLQQIGGLLGAGRRTGTRLVSPALAIDGDVAIVQGEALPLLGVRVAEVWLCASTTGLHVRPMSAARIAWGVGRA